MACKISRFPQTAVLANGRSIIECRGLSVGEEIKSELRNGVDASSEEGADGTTPFYAGVGHYETLNIFNYE